MQHPNAHVGLSGRVSFELSQGGVIVQTGDQSNLITNAGLDGLAVHSFLPAVLNGTFARGTWKQFGTVGEGSVAPAVTDTALSAPLSAGGGTTATGGVSEIFENVSPGVYRYTNTLEFAEGQAIGNLTEFGFSSGNDTPLHVRELFRDSGGVPIVVTKTNTQKLRLTHKLTITLGPFVEVAQSTPMSGDASGDLGGSVLLARAANIDADAAALGYWMCGDNKVTVITHTFTAPMSYQGGGMTNSADKFSPQACSALSFSTYVPGTYQRTLDAVWDTDKGNGEFTGVHLATKLQDYWRAGFRHRFAAPFTKDDLHRLTLSGWLLTWGRA